MNYGILPLGQTFTVMRKCISVALRLGQFEFSNGVAKITNTVCPRCRCSLSAPLWYHSAYYCIDRCLYVSTVPCNYLVLPKPIPRTTESNLNNQSMQEKISISTDEAPKMQNLDGKICRLYARECATCSSTLALHSPLHFFMSLLLFQLY